MRKDNNYRVIIEQINVEPEASQTVQFEFQDREDVFKAVENIRQGSGLEESTATKAKAAVKKTTATAKKKATAAKTTATKAAKSASAKVEEATA